MMSRTGLRALCLAAGLAFASTAMAQQPPRGGTMIIALEGEPGTLSAFNTTDVVALIGANNIFSGLVTQNFKFEVQPDLAERWEIAPDGLTYRFFLNPRAKWHDGKPVTAADAEFTFNEIVAKQHPRAGTWWPNVASARAEGPHTFAITLKTPYAPFMTLMASALASGVLILPKHVYETGDPKTNPANQRPIGSGPFKFVQWTRGSHIELARNPDYFKPDLPRLDRIVMQVLPDASARMLAFERGEVDYLHHIIVPQNEISRLRKDPRFRMVDPAADGSAITAVAISNFRNQYLKDPRVRQAIAYALDRKDIQSKALFGEGKVAHSVVNSGLSWAFTDKYDVYTQNLDKARHLLDEAGFRAGADGKRFTLRYAWATGRDAEGRAAEIMRDQLRRVGIELQVQAFDRATFIDRVFINWDFDMASQFYATGPDPTIGVAPRFHSSQIRKAAFVNGMGYSSPEMDRLLDLEQTQTDVAARTETWARIQALLMTDLPAIPLYEIPVVHATSAKLREVITQPLGYVQSRETAYFER